MKKLNNKGAVLISAYMVLFVLMTVSSSVALFNFSELRESRRYRNAVTAFWLAEAGLNEYMADVTILDDAESLTIKEVNGTIHLSRDDSDPRYRIVTSKGVVGGSQRQIQIKYPALTTIFESTVSTKGDMIIEGSKSSLMVNDKLRLGGEVINTSTYPIVFIEDKQEGVTDPLVSITYPDFNQNGVSDEFDDFVQYNRSLIASYPEEEVVYIKDNATYTIMPDSSLENKKIIYIEGERPGQGNAIVQFTAALGEQQNLTIISTGTVTHNQAGIANSDSQLNIIAWSDYFESSALPSVHYGMIYTHGTAYFDEVHDTSVTNGSVVANEGIVIREVWSTKTFNYADMRKRGVVPPGFEGLVGGGVSGYTPKPNEWREVQI
jgi:hypothetical protein